MLWLAGDIKEPTRSSERVGHEVPSVVVWPLLLSEGWGGECSEILATINLLYNHKHSKHSIHIHKGSKAPFQLYLEKLSLGLANVQYCIVTFWGAGPLPSLFRISLDKMQIVLASLTTNKLK